MLINRLYDEILDLPRLPQAIACSPETLRQLRDEAEDAGKVQWKPSDEPRNLMGTPVEVYDHLPDGAIRPIYSREDRDAVRAEANLRRFGLIKDGAHYSPDV